MDKFKNDHLVPLSGQIDFHSGKLKLKLVVRMASGVQILSYRLLTGTADWLARGTHDMMIAGSRLTAATQ